ncbi:hypothetical protein BJX96DRAFT_169774 [Aspergillus floccosus]
MVRFEEDARALEKAMRGWRKDNDTIMRIVLSISLVPQHSVLLQATYKQVFNRDLVKDLRWTTSGMFKKAIEALMLGPVWLNLNRLLKAFPYSPIPSYQPYAEVIFYRTTAQLEAFKETYLHRCSYPIKEHIDISSKRTRQLPQLYVEPSRPDNGSDAVDAKGIDVDARELYDTLPHQGKDAEVSAMVARCSHQRLVAISDAFRSIYVLSLEDYIKEKLSGDFQTTLTWLLTWARDPGEYRALFEAGKAKLDAEGFDFHPFRELVYRIYDGLV